ncbi:MAG: peptidoglycan-associated lipoprotein Pal [Elusimicrobiota bacterium]
MMRSKSVLIVEAMLVFVLIGVLGCGPKRLVMPPEITTPVVTDQDEEPAISSKEFVSIVDLEDVNFDFDQAVVRADARQILEKNAEYLKTKPELFILVEGHCDERGSVEYNLALGQRRATAVRNYYLKLGLRGSRITTISYGEEKPLEYGSNENAWAKNRRAETKVKAQSK